MYTNFNDVPVAEAILYKSKEVGRLTAKFVVPLFGLQLSVGCRYAVTNMDGWDAGQPNHTAGCFKSRLG